MNMHTIRNCFSKVWNKQFLIFLFFLALSSIFWLFMSLNETYEEEFIVPFELKDVPDNVVLTTDLPEGMHVTLRDKGIILLTYRYTGKFTPIVIDFNQYANATNHITISGAELVRNVMRQLTPSTQLVNFKPEALDFFYNHGECKKVPVVVTGSVEPGLLYTIASTKATADTVLVYASREQLDTITAAYTRSLRLKDLTDTTSVKASFQPIHGVKFVPDHVGLTFCVDRMIEKTIEVPVQQVNFPASKQLRTFPAKVHITFQVSMGQYRKVNSDNFVLVVNYESLLGNKTNKTRLSLKTTPTGVKHVRIYPQDVEYIIEDIPVTEELSPESAP